MISILFLSFLVATLVIFLLWLKSLNIFRIGNFPTPPSYFLIGHVPYVNTNDKVLPFVHQQLMKNNGFFKLYIGLQATLCVSDNEFSKWILNSTDHITKSDQYKFLKNWLGDGLILATGAHWKLHRKLLTPAFHFKMIENHVSTLRNTTTILTEKFEQNLEQSSLDVYPLIASFALDAVFESTMATSINAQENNKSEYLQSVQKLCRIFYERSLSVLKMFNVIFQFHPDFKIFQNSVKCINAFITSVIRKRRLELENGTKTIEKDAENIYERKKTPFIDIILNARDENNQCLSDQEILDEVNTFIFAGYETTTAAISFSLYNLAQYREVQDRAFEEQKEIFGLEKNPYLTNADLSNMKYLEMVIKETLRLYPSVPIIGREIQEDTYYEGKLLPKGLPVHLCLYSLQRNPKLFPEPEKFDPSRFENEANFAYSYVPFSAGQRNCIGQKFAMIEMKQAISAILRKFELLPVPGHVLKIRAETSLKSSNGICIRLRRRE